MEEIKIQPKDKKIKVMISKNVFEALENVKIELKKRGIVVGSDPKEILDYIFENMDQNILNDFIEQRTPDEYKLKMLSQNTKFKEDLKKLIQTYEKKKKLTNDSASFEALN